MEQGRRLLAALEVAGAALFTVGLVLRSAHRRLRPLLGAPRTPLKGHLVLVIGADHPLGCELSIQLLNKECRVACIGASSLRPLCLPHSAPYYCCDSSQPRLLARVSECLTREMGQLDIVVWAPREVEHNEKTPLDQIAGIVNEDLMKHFHVASQFVPVLSKTQHGGHFVTVQPFAVPSGSFAATGVAITALADTLIHQMDLSGKVKLTRVVRRPMRSGDEEDMRESAMAILRAVEVGDSCITLPTAKQHIKNTIRYLKRELGYIWNQKILRQWKLAA